MYEPVIGLETHIELLTKTKMFCSCDNSFGKAPGSVCCPVCTGMPGTLPALNEEAVNYAIKAGIALNCKINNISQFSRKNYTYPDLPKAYQITQDELPLCENGHILLNSGKKIRIKRIHLEEDAGKIIREENGIFVDYNRCGVPLIEIVTEPDFSNSSEVKEYLETLIIIIKTLGISDCKMQEGSLRCDVNLSIKNENTKYEKVEIKNLNSINFIVKGIESEIKRQICVIESGDKITSETRRFNEKTLNTEFMRKKESREEYRYILEPDLPDLYVDESTIKNIRESMPILPKEKEKIYCEKYGLKPHEAEKIIKYPSISEVFEQISEKTKNGALCGKIIINYIFTIVKDENLRDKGEFLNAEYISQVVSLVEKGVIKSGKIQEVLTSIISEKKSFYDIYSLEDFEQIDEKTLVEICKKKIEENKKAKKDYLAGRKKAIFAITGAVMKEVAGNADAKTVTRIIEKQLGE